MEHLTSHIFPPLAHIVEEYVDPQSLLIITIQTEIGECYIKMSYSEVMDPAWIKLILQVQQMYPTKYVTIYRCGKFRAWFRDIKMRVVDQPELIEAFERIYGTETGDVELFDAVINGIFTIYAELTGTDPMHFDSDDPYNSDIYADLATVIQYFNTTSL